VVAGALESWPLGGDVVDGGGAGAVVVDVGAVDVLGVCRDDGTATLCEMAQPAATTDARATATPGAILHHAEPDPP
jgi:hypothetical protein